MRLCNNLHVAALRKCRFIIVINIIILSPPAQSAGRKTRLDMQNYGCKGNLFCDHGVVERNRISSLVLGSFVFALIIKN